MSDTSVWYEQVDKGLLKVISETFGEEVKVRFRSDDDFTQLSYPCIVITHIGEKFDRYRYEDREVIIDNKGDMVVVEPSAKPYTLHYQIELWSTSITEVNDLTFKWCDIFTDYNNLDVIDIGDNPRNCYMKLVGSVTSFEDSTYERRIFKRIYTYDIKVEIDRGKAYMRDKVTKIELK